MKVQGIFALLLLLSLSFAFTTNIITDFPASVVAGNSYTATYGFQANAGKLYDMTLYINETSSGTTITNEEINASISGVTCLYVNRSNQTQEISNNSLEGTRLCKGTTIEGWNYVTVTIEINPYLAPATIQNEVQFGLDISYVAPYAASSSYGSTGGSGGGFFSQSRPNPTPQVTNNTNVVSKPPETGPIVSQPNDTIQVNSTNRTPQTFDTTNTSCAGDTCKISKTEDNASLILTFMGPLKNEDGSMLIPALIVVGIVLVGGAGVWYFTRKKDGENNDELSG